MIYKDINIHTLFEDIKGKPLICFGAGRLLQSACREFSSLGFFERIDYIADNDREKRNFFFEGAIKPVIPIEDCLRAISERGGAGSCACFVLITVQAPSLFDIVKQLHKIPELASCFYSVYTMMRVCDAPSPYELQVGRAEREGIKIPKVIHYSWFGGGAIPDVFLSYMESWKRHCPDYEIVRWDESNYDYKKNEYMFEAYRRKMWGFVPDFMRLDIIYQHGGVYLDTDVELIKNIDDLLCDEAFCGFETADYVNNGSGFGATPGFPLIREQMEYYDKLSFLREDGSPDTTSGPWHQTRLFLAKGLILNNSLQVIEGMRVYPTDVLSPISWRTGIIRTTKNTYAIHHYSGSWLSEQKAEKNKVLSERYRCLHKRLTMRDP